MVQHKHGGTRRSEEVARQRRALRKKPTVRSVCGGSPAAHNTNARTSQSLWPSPPKMHRSFSWCSKSYHQPSTGINSFRGRALASLAPAMLSACKDLHPRLRADTPASITRPMSATLSDTNRGQCLLRAMRAPFCGGVHK